MEYDNLVGCNQLAQKMVSGTNVLVVDENAVVPDSWRVSMLSSYVWANESWRNVNSLTNQTDIRVLGSRMLVWCTPIRTTWVQPQVACSNSTSWSCREHLQVTWKRAIIVGELWLASGYPWRVKPFEYLTDSELRRSLKVSEYPVRGHNVFIPRVAHRTS